MPFFVWLAAAVWPILSKFLDVGRDVTKTLFNFITSNWKLFIKWWIFLAVINLFLTLLSFFVYSIYYWWAYIISHFVTLTTLNIIHMAFLWSVIYFIYKFMYKDN